MEKNQTIDDLLKAPKRELKVNEGFFHFYLKIIQIPTK